MINALIMLLYVQENHHRANAVSQHRCSLFCSLPLPWQIKPSSRLKRLSSICKRHLHPAVHAARAGR